MCRRRSLTIVLPLHKLSELLHYTPLLVGQFLAPTSHFKAHTSTSFMKCKNIWVPEF